MTDLIWLALLLFILPFGVVPFLGAPYVPSKRKQLIPFLKSLDIKKGQSLLDIGSGDGTVLVHAADQLGLGVKGIELNPFLVAWSRLRLFKFRKRSSVQYGNMWTTKIPETDIIYVFMMPKFMDRLEEKIQSEITKKTLVVTYSFSFTNHKAFAEKDGFMAFTFEPLAK